MKEVINKLSNFEKLKTSEIAESAVRHFIAALIGFTASKGVALGSLLPFGLSVVAGCPQVFLPSVAIGTFIGYFFPSVENMGFRYIAALLAILAIRLMVSAYKKTASNPFFLGGICLGAEILTAAVTLSDNSESIIYWITEGLLCATGAYFCSKTCHAFSHRRVGFSGEETAALLISVNAVLLGLMTFSFSGVSLGRIAGVLIILTAAKYGGTLSGAVSGITFSLFCSLSGAKNGGYMMYSTGGMFAGIFSSLGRYAQIISLAVATVIGVAVSDFNTGIAPLAVELFIGSLLFLMMPKKIGIMLGKLFACYPKIAVPTNIKKALTMRLKMASGALCDVSDTVDQVSRELAKINAPDFGKVLSDIEHDACTGCKLRIHCWESRKDDTVEAILSMTKAVKQGEYSPSEFATDEFKGRCLKLTKIGETVCKRYSEYTCSIAAENRIDEVRGVVSEQFNGISDMLADLARDFDNDSQFDSTSATRAAAALQNLDIHTDECSGRIDKYGRMTIELKIKKTAETVLNRMQIMKAVSIACERDFDAPNISEVGGDIFISLSEHADYRVDIGAYQVSAGRSDMCGDAYQYFNDGKGHFIMVLSDGMGTGGRAAVDGAMASGLMSRLLKSGFGYDCSLKILNSSMLFKSSDESTATVDIASIDLFTGETELYKAGAAPTIVRRGGRTGKAVSTSLPIGILSDISFDRAGIKLSSGDVLLLLSDGAVTEGTDWIRAELEAWRDGSAEDLAEHIGECARRRRTDSHEDDITVLAATLEKAV